MSSERDLPRILQAWLHEDGHEYGDRVLDSVLDRLDTTPQSPASWLARRFQIMNNNLVRYGLAAAAVVVIAIIGFQLLGGSSVGGPGPSPSVAPSEAVEPTPSAPASTSASAEPSIPADGSLPEGPFTLWDAPGDVAITVTIPAPGWFGDEGGGMLVNENANPPTSAGLIVFQGPLYVYGDACHWSTTTPDTPATTTAELTAALEAQTSHYGGVGGEGWNIGGIFGRGVNLSVPNDAIVSGCDGGQLRYWVGDPQLDTNARYHEGPGQVDELWVGDVNGVPVVFDVFYAGTPRNVVDELWIVVDHDATTFEMP